MAPVYKVAVVQLYPKVWVPPESISMQDAVCLKTNTFQPMQPAKNFAKAERFIRSAAEQGCDLVVLPEYHLTNWLPKDPKFLAMCADSQKYLKSYQDLARDLKICIVPGTIVEVRSHVDVKAATVPPKEVVGMLNSDTVNNSFENIAYFIDNKGEILGRYSKKNLWGPTERAHITSSGRQKHIAFDTPLGKVGMLICWDIAFPEAFRELIAQDAKIIIVPCFCKFMLENKELVSILMKLISCRDIE